MPSTTSNLNDIRHMPIEQKREFLDRLHRVGFTVEDVHFLGSMKGASYLRDLRDKIRSTPDQQGSEFFNDQYFKLHRSFEIQLPENFSLEEMKSNGYFDEIDDVTSFHFPQQEPLVFAAGEIVTVYVYAVSKKSRLSLADYINFIEHNKGVVPNAYGLCMI